MENKRKGNGKWKSLAGYFPHVFLWNTCALHLPQCTFACPNDKHFSRCLVVFFMNCIVSLSLPLLFLSFFLLVAAATTSGHKWRGKLWHFLFSVKFQLWTNMTTLSIGNPKPARGGKQSEKCNIFVIFSFSLSFSIYFLLFLYLAVFLAFSETPEIALLHFHGRWGVHSCSCFISGPARNSHDSYQIITVSPSLSFLLSLSLSLYKLLRPLTTQTWLSKVFQ